MRMWCVSNWVTLALIVTQLGHFTDKATGKYGWTTFGADGAIHVLDSADSQVGQSQLQSLPRCGCDL